MALGRQLDVPAYRSPPASRSDQKTWTEGWCEAVRHSPHSLALIELPSTKFRAVSPSAARLLGISAADASRSDYLSMIEPRAQVEQTIRMLGVGALDSVDARRRVRHPDGSTLDIHMRAHAVRRNGHAELVLWAAVEDPVEHPDPEHPVERSALPSPAPMGFERDVASSLLATLDQRWRITALGTDLHSFLGHAPDVLRGSSILHMTHPADSANLLSAFALATSGTNDSVRIRVRAGDGTFQPVTAMLSLLDRPDGPDRHDGSRFAVALDVDAAPELSDDTGRIHALEQRLHRIAAEVNAAGLSTALPVDDVAALTLPELSDRQREVVTRLARGERVLTIATDMYLSPSTVRNHLSAIFAKLGVHSQRELLEVLRPVRSPDLNGHAR